MTNPSDTPDQFDQFDDEESDQQLGATASGRKRLFSKELRCMMYGFGDDKNPYTESVDFLEDLVIEFITETTHKAMEVGRPGRVQVEDIIFLVRKDPRKYARVKDLLTMNEELKKARKAFDEVKYVVMSVCQLNWNPVIDDKMVNDILQFMSSMRNEDMIRMSEEEAFHWIFINDKELKYKT